jgi:hypothetical protein
VIKQKHWGTSLFVCLLSALTTSARAQINYTPYIDSSFVLFWPSPVRAHPDVPVDFRFSVYEMNNEALTWQLTGAPNGMTIDTNGKVNWTPAASDAGNYIATVSVTRSSGSSIVRTFTLSVNTTDFIFVAPTGNDAAAGTMAAPFKTIEHAMLALANGNGKTIYVRGGTYCEHYTSVFGPFSSKHFTAADPAEVRGYPGEKAIVDCESQGMGIQLASTSNVIISNIEVQNANWGEKGGIVFEDNCMDCMAKDVIVHDSHWLYGANCTGFRTQTANVVIDRCISYNNFDTADPHFLNSTNFLSYNDVDLGVNYILNSISYGSCIGFKIKHAGPLKVIFHNNISHNDDCAFACGSDYSSVRYCVSYNSGTGIQAGLSDPSTDNVNSVLFEHNTIFNASDWGFQIISGYLMNGTIVRNNIFYNSLDVAGTGEGDNRLMGLWIYTANPTTYSLDSDKNLFFSPSQNNIIRFGNSNYNYSFSTWKSSRNHDVNSIFGDPLFSDTANGNYTIPVSSLANFGSGQFAGAFPPGGIVSIQPKSPWNPIKVLPSISAKSSVTIFNMQGRKLWSGCYGAMPAKNGILFLLSNENGKRIVHKWMVLNGKQGKHTGK